MFIIKIICCKTSFSFFPPNVFYSNTTGANNTGVGLQALYRNTTGISNTALGILALYNNATGTNNTGVGFSAGLSYNASETNNTCLGYNVTGTAGESNTIRIGNSSAATFISTAVSQVVAAGGTAVIVSSTGQVGIVASSVRFKKNIQDMGSYSEKIHSLRPVIFQYKTQEDNRMQKIGRASCRERV